MAEKLKKKDLQHFLNYKLTFGNFQTILRDLKILNYCGQDVGVDVSDLIDEIEDLECKYSAIQEILKDTNSKIATVSRKLREPEENQRVEQARNAIATIAEAIDPPRPRAYPIHWDDNVDMPQPDDNYTMDEAQEADNGEMPF